MIWGSAYSSSKFYKTVFQSIDAHPIFKWVWKSRCTNWVKFFAWLILVDRLNTPSMLKRRHLLGEDEVACVMCTAGPEEDIDHLFFQCLFAQQCWQKVNVTWNNMQSLPTRVDVARSQSNTGFFMEVVLIAACEIWKMRNRKIFDNDRISLASWFVNFKAQCRLQSVRFKDDLWSSFCVWLDAFSLFCCFTLVVYSSNICKYAFPAFMKKENGSAVVNSPHIFLPSKK